MMRRLSSLQYGRGLLLLPTISSSSSSSSTCSATLTRESVRSLMSKAPFSTSSWTRQARVNDEEEARESSIFTRNTRSLSRLSSRSSQHSLAPRFPHHPLFRVQHRSMSALGNIFRGVAIIAVYIPAALALFVVRKLMELVHFILKKISGPSPPPEGEEEKGWKEVSFSEYMGEVVKENLESMEKHVQENVQRVEEFIRTNHKLRSLLGGNAVVIDQELEVSDVVPEVEGVLRYKLSSDDGTRVVGTLILEITAPSAEDEDENGMRSLFWKSCSLEVENIVYEIPLTESEQRGNSEDEVVDANFRVKSDEKPQSKP